MIKGSKPEISSIFAVVVLIFLLFLIIPIIYVFVNALSYDGSISTENLVQIFGTGNFIQIIKNSLWVSVVSAGVSTALAFVLAYTVEYTNINVHIKSVIKCIATMPMLLPTITYGFAIIYSFGKQGFITKILGRQYFEIYGFNGLVLGFTIYTLPISYMLISNTMGYIDKKYMIVSNVMGDSSVKTFVNTVLRPMVGTIAASCVQTFFLCFTDFGIPAAVGGEYKVISSSLYSEMLGSVPNFNTGSVIAILMLIPSVVSIGVLTYLEKYNIRYQKISPVELKNNRVRDIVLGMVSLAISLGIVSIFFVIIIIPFVKEWPYDISFTLDNIMDSLSSSNLGNVYIHSIAVAGITAIAGTIIAYGSALVTARSNIDRIAKKILDSVSLITNTVPGMVLGIAYLLTFSGTSLQNTFLILIICNIVHYFSTPYLMFKNSLEKMNSSWEVTAMLMGDSWIKTILRIVTPNAISTVWEVLSYYFVNAMVTISAVVFLVGARTAVITTKIKELQHFSKFNEIFILSLMIMITNIITKIILNKLSKRSKVK